ncbi:MAG: hypothetical protein ACJ8G2_02410 [Burkholderiales bacterium]|jgi:hypothetical protein
MEILPDPRHYVACSPNPLVRLARSGAPPRELAAALRHALGTGDDRIIEQALAESNSYSVFRALSDALDDALKAADSVLHFRLFAIPILMVIGGRAPVVVPGVVPDINEVSKVFESNGILGPMKNFGISTSLVSEAGLAAVKPSVLYQRQRASSLESFSPLDFPPEEVIIERSEEQVYLRFLTGVSVTSADAPGFTETAGDIGAWGMSFTRALAAQLAQPGLSLLPIPRAAASPRQALEAGTFALCELTLQLFLSNALRKFRSRAGEPDAAVFACDDHSVRVRLSSPFDISLSDDFVWRLPPGHDMAQVSKAVFSLLADCRVENVQVGETVQLVSASH